MAAKLLYKYLNKGSKRNYCNLNFAGETKPRL